MRIPHAGQLTRDIVRGQIARERKIRIQQLLVKAKNIAYCLWDGTVFVATIVAAGALLLLIEDYIKYPPF